MRTFVSLVSFIALAGMCASAFAQDTGAGSFAATMNASGRMYHDRSFNGPEVVYRSSGPATQDGAMAAWMRSPGHRALVSTGQITDVQCIGNVCVGRGAGTVTKSSTVTRTATRRRWFR